MGHFKMSGAESLRKSWKASSSSSLSLSLSGAVAGHRRLLLVHDAAAQGGPVPRAVRFVGDLFCILNEVNKMVIDRVHGHIMHRQEVICHAHAFGIDRKAGLFECEEKSSPAPGGYQKGPNIP